MQDADTQLGQHIRAHYNELFGQQFITTEYGFIGYRDNGDELIIDELYLRPEYRSGWNVKRFADTFVKLYQVHHTKLVAFVNHDASQGMRVERLFQFYGMTRDLTHNQSNYFKYEKDI